MRKVEAEQAQEGDLSVAAGLELIIPNCQTHEPPMDNANEAKPVRLCLDGPFRRYGSRLTGASATNRLSGSQAVTVAMASMLPSEAKCETVVPPMRPSS